MKTVFFVVLIVFLFQPCSHAIEGEDAIINRTIKIEGSVEKPRTIFIVPKAILWKEDISSMSFIDELLEPVYPEHLMEDEGPQKR